jgi:N-acetyl-alpha-D-glucosaminyl L-malate synthase BshA
VSENLAKRTRENFCRAPLHGCAIEVIPNGVDTELFHPSKGEGKRPQVPAVVHVSNFRAVKRVPWLIEAFGRATRDTSASLTLVGDGPEQPAARAKARELGLETRVTFTGERDALAETLATSDVFALSSSDESFGLSALEAMSSGTAVVATDVGGVREVVEDGVTGLLSGADDLDAFAANLKRLITDRSRARALGAAGRMRAEQRFARETVVLRYEALYRRLLDTP